jgi:Phosphotransferase enzyme family
VSASTTPTETERNALLRRVDWRFLLRQDAEPAASATSAHLASALELVSTSPPAGDEPLDLVALVHPNRRTLEAAVRALRPGGEVYVERYVPRLRGASRIRRHLESCGLTDVRCYWPWPAPGHGTQFWLPVDSPGAMEYFLSLNRRWRPWRRRLLERLWAKAARLGLLAPLCALGRKPEGEDPLLERSVRQLHPDGAISWLLLTGGRRSVNKVVGLGIVDRQPRLVVKFARSPSEDDGLRREAAVLSVLETAHPSLRGLPRLLFVERRSGRVALGETMLRGSPVLEQLNRSTFAALAQQVTEWLVALAGRAEPVRATLWWGRLVEEPLNYFEHAFAATLSADEIAYARQALAMPDVALPLVVEQRDVAPWNTLLDDDGTLAVVDWESAELEGLPALDLVYFLTQAALVVGDALDSGAARDAYARSLDPATELGRIVDQCESLYCARVGVDPPLLRPLRLLCWTIHARSEYERLTADAGARPGRDALDASVFLGLWREELRRQPI